MTGDLHANGDCWPSQCPHCMAEDARAGMTNHVVMFSGGLGSWMTAKRVLDQHDRFDVTLLFADVSSGRSPHAAEDEDTYRFISEARHNLDAELVTVSDGRDIWQVFHDNRFLGNTRLANCSKFLKQKPCRDWLETNCDPDDTVVYVGIDWSETHRLPDVQSAYAHPFGKPCGRTAPCHFAKPCSQDRPCRKHRPCTPQDPCLARLALPWTVNAPLTEKPYLDRADLMDACEAAGMTVPRLYRAGFAHNNCGGFCVRSGQAQMELLLREHPERYAFHEAEEQKLRDHLAKDVAVLRDRTDRTTTPLTLSRFRERIERDPSLFDQQDVGGCGCFVAEEAGA